MQSDHANSADHDPVSVQLYLVIYAVLMALLAVTIGVAYLKLGNLNLTVAIIIAVVKAALVILYFMHVRYSSRLTWLFAGAGIVWLLIMILGTLGDYLYRYLTVVGQ